MSQSSFVWDVLTPHWAVSELRNAGRPPSARLSPENGARRAERLPAMLRVRPRFSPRPARPLWLTPSQKDRSKLEVSELVLRYTLPAPPTA